MNGIDANEFRNYGLKGKVSKEQFYRHNSQRPNYGARFTVNKDGKPVADINIGDQKVTEPAISGSIKINPSVSVDVKVSAKDIVSVVDWFLRRYGVGDNKRGDRNGL